MWPASPSADSLTRPRVAVAVVSIVAAASIGYYAYQSRRNAPLRGTPTGGGLHRSNAIRRSRPRASTTGGDSNSPSEAGGDENADADGSQVAAEAGNTIEVVDVGDDWWSEQPPTTAANLSTPQRVGHSIVTLLFRVSEDNARRNGCVHRGCQCNSCGMVPIRGVRYRCANCADFDLCETCEAQGMHIKTHIFYKIKVPAPPFGPRQMQPVWYTGDPDSCCRSIPRNLIARLSRDSGFERPELEAFWEQWTYMANTEWRDDPDELCVAMDRKTFERCLVPTGGSRHAAPNLIHERMFSFYDSNNDGLIGFSEFLHGLSYRKRKDKLKKVFEGYDIDGDGYVNRRDFLRMFRAYYVLYKQMHKDILDGLEDQLLASTEAQQLVSARQPLSSLFGREGHLPAGDSGFRFEGKTNQKDGSVDVADDYSSAFVESRGDTAPREDILASLFAYHTVDLRNALRHVSSRPEPDINWRTVRRASGGDIDRAQWMALFEPPTTLEGLAGLLQDDADGDGDGDGEEDEEESVVDVDALSGAGGPTYSELRTQANAKSRELAPRLEKQRRDMARTYLHDRWKRRQFYLDEEEGGLAPNDWDGDEDILAKYNQMAEDASKARDAPPVATRSRSSSKVRFAEDTDDYEIRSNPSTSSRSMPERWGGMDIPAAERDAGKEILYQVTQQAFNELLDTIFQKAEDVAFEAAATAEERAKYKMWIDTIEPLKTEPKATKQPADPDSTQIIPPTLLEEMMAGTEMTVESSEPRNAVELEIPVEPVLNHASGTDDGAAAEFRDPTLPQFRPNTVAEAERLAASEPAPAHTFLQRALPPFEMGDRPVLATLQRWRRISLAEARAAERGGWGLLSFEEFEEIYKSQEDLGNRLDYLGSWIDFCIP